MEDAVRVLVGMDEEVAQLALEVFDHSRSWSGRLVVPNEPYELIVKGEEIVDGFVFPQVTHKGKPTTKDDVTDAVKAAGDSAGVKLVIRRTEAREGCGGVLRVVELVCSHARKYENRQRQPQEGHAIKRNNNRSTTRALTDETRCPANVVVRIFSSFSGFSLQNLTSPIVVLLLLFVQLRETEDGDVCRWQVVRCCIHHKYHAKEEARPVRMLGMEKRKAKEYAARGLKAVSIRELMSIERAFPLRTQEVQDALR